MGRASVIRLIDEGCEEVCFEACAAHSSAWL